MTKFLIGLIVAILIAIISGVVSLKLFQPEPQWITADSGIMKPLQELTLAQQVNQGSTLEEASKWKFSNAIIFFSWQSRDKWGVDFTNSNKIEYKINDDNIAKVTVPDLKYFGPAISLAPGEFQAKVVNKGWLIDETELLKDFLPVINEKVIEKGERMLQSQAFVEFCRATLEDFLFRIAVNDLDKPVKIESVKVKFESEDNYPSDDIERLPAGSVVDFEYDQVEPPNNIDIVSDILVAQANSWKKEDLVTLSIDQVKGLEPITDPMIIERVESYDWERRQFEKFIVNDHPVSENIGVQMQLNPETISNAIFPEQRQIQ